MGKNRYVLVGISETADEFGFLCTTIYRNGLIQRKYPESGSSVGKIAMLIPEVKKNTLARHDSKNYSNSKNKGDFIRSTY